MINNSQFIPVLTTEAGCCLTMANWQEVGVKTTAFDLTSLLMKPGFALLSTLPDLTTYTGSAGRVVLNATMPEANKDGGYTLRSEYDGSRTHYSQDDILNLISQLKPEMVIMPHGSRQLWRSLPDSMMPFFFVDDLPDQADRPYGVYFYYDTTISISSLIQVIQKYQDIPCYVGGELSLTLMNELAEHGVQFLSSDIPARDACRGMVYYKDVVFSLMDDDQTTNFNVIDDQCRCPTCVQNMSRAYLHHLLEHTPLLCQRFLIQHNIYRCLNSPFDF